MNGMPFAFTYADSTGAEDSIVLDAMRKLWVDRDRSGIVFAQAAEDGTELLHEVVIEGADVADGMADIMVTLLGVPSFERLEAPIHDADRARLLLEFRYPHPQTVALAFRA
jgi:hypothetical protein